MSFTPLTAGECRLANDPTLVELFNRRAEMFQQVEQLAPTLLTADAGVQLINELAQVRSRLTRQRYQVGFIGPFQIGKSSTFNNLTELSDADTPSPEGGVGAATSSTVVRVYNSGGKPHFIKLRYLTPKEYSRKLEALSKAAGFTGLSAEQLLLELPKRIEDLHKGKGSETIGPSDYEYLQRLLASHQQFGAKLLREPALIREDVLYDDRKDHLMHNRTARESENMLLLQAEIGVNTTGIPPELEMIDLPGLNSQGTVDSILTETFLKELDAALLLAPAGQIGNADTEKSFARLAEKFEGRLTKRLWIVITMFDSLNKHAFHGDERGDTIFHTIKRLLEKFRLQADRVFLISNPIYKIARKNTGTWPNDEMRSKLEKYPGDLGPDWVPAEFKQFPDLCDVYENSLLKDGGLGRLRELITSRLAELVRRDICDWAREKLDRLSSGLQALVETAIRHSKLDVDGLRRVNICRNRLLQIIHQLAISPEPYKEPAAKLLEGLMKEFNQHCPDAHTLELLRPAQLAQTFRQNAVILEDRLGRLTEEVLIPLVYKFIREKTSDLPPVEVNQSQSIQEAWDALKAQDIAKPEWRSMVFPTFHSEDLFELHQGAANGVVHRLNGRSYRPLLEEKIKLTVHQALFAVRQRATEHALDMNKQIEKLLDKQITTGPSSGVVQLENLRTQIQRLS